MDQRQPHCHPGFAVSVIADLGHGAGDIGRAAERTDERHARLRGANIIRPAKVIRGNSRFSIVSAKKSELYYFNACWGSFAAIPGLRTRRGSRLLPSPCEERAGRGRGFGCGRRTRYFAVYLNCGIKDKKVPGLGLRPAPALTSTYLTGALPAAPSASGRSASPNSL
jgi:hypothetical protein